MNRLREKTTATLLIAIFMISAMALIVPARAHQVEVDGLMGIFTVKEAPKPKPPLSPGFIAGIVIAIISASALGYVLLRRRQL